MSQICGLKKNPVTRTMPVALAPKADASLLLRTVLGARLYKRHPTPGSLFIVGKNLSNQAAQVIDLSPS